MASRYRRLRRIRMQRHPYGGMEMGVLDAGRDAPISRRIRQLLWLGLTLLFVVGAVAVAASRGG